MKTNKQKLKELFRCNIAGVQYGDYQLCLGLKAGLKLDLYWERSNTIDPMAIRVEYRGVKLGYIPKGEFQIQLHSLRTKGIKTFSSLTAVNKNNPTWAMFTLKCEVREKNTARVNEEF